MSGRQLEHEAGPSAAPASAIPVPGSDGEVGRREVETEDDGSDAATPVALEPFLHQVGGHFPMVTLDDDTVCKPLNEREHKFYRTLPNVLRPYAPSYEGTMKVEASEDEEGYILLRGQPPPQLMKERNHSRASSNGGHRGRSGDPSAPPSSAGSVTPVRCATVFCGSSRHHSVSGLSTPGSLMSGGSLQQQQQMHFRLKRKAKIEMEAFSVDSVSGFHSAMSTAATSPSTASELQSAVRAAAEMLDRSNGQIMDQRKLVHPPDQIAFYNPWALKCHRDHLKKLGLLPPPSGSLAEDSPLREDKDTTIGRTSRSNPQIYLLLENLVSKYRRPCVLDLKVGARQYADDVSSSKKQRKIAKAKNTTLNSLGLRLCGMQVYSNRTGRYTCRNKYHGRQLTPTTFRSTIRQFFDPDAFEEVERHELRTVVLDRLISKLQDLKRVIGELDSFRFYTSSLLLTYDAFTDSHPGSPESTSPRGGVAAPAPDQASLHSSLSSYDLSEVLVGGCGVGGAEEEDDEERDSHRVDLRIIDFANSTHSGMAAETGGVLHAGPDSGFLHGLDTLLGILTDIRAGRGDADSEDVEDETDELTVSGDDTSSLATIGDNK